ncbi:MAG TPA: hypothetical protein VFO67_21020 [Gemmatimonadales bacterium]|nr:hypothetical protein [Gemmatimonadales bacterium]
MLTLTRLGSGPSLCRFPFLGPRHHRPQPRAHLLDLRVPRGAAQLVEPGSAGPGLRDPLFGKCAAADVRQQALHFLTHGGRDDALTPGQITILGGVADRMPHEAEAAPIDQIDDQLQLVETFEVRHLGRVPGFGQRLEAGLNQRRHAAAQHRLLAEQVGFGFFGERRGEDARARATDPGRIRERVLERLAAGVLVHGDEARHAAAGLIFTAHEVSWRLGRDHRDIDAWRRLDLAEMDVEAVREHQRLSSPERGGHRGLIDCALLGVGHEHHDHITRLGGVGDRPHLQAVVARALPRRAVRPQPHDYARTALLQVERVGVPLTAVADDGEHAIAQSCTVGIRLVVDAYR